MALFARLNELVEVASTAIRQQSGGISHSLTTLKVGVLEKHLQPKMRFRYCRPTLTYVQDNPLSIKFFDKSRKEREQVFHSFKDAYR